LIRINAARTPRPEPAGTVAQRSPAALNPAEVPMVRNAARYAVAKLPRYTSYPTAAEFGPEVDAGTYGVWLDALPAETELSLYLHVPFCAELCHYCGCTTTAVKRYGPVADFVEVLALEIGLVADRLADGGGERRPVTHIHWGGGTPTTLSGADMEWIGNLLKERFDIRADAEIAVEIDPRRVGEKHLAAFRALGVNRASVGVQDFDPVVQKAIGRIQTIEETRGAIAGLRAAGVEGVNVDLVYGLPYQTPDGFSRTLQEVVAMAPDRIALFGYAHVPWMKRNQALIPEAALPSTEERLIFAERSAAELTAAGYVTVGLDHFARPDDPLAQAAAGGDLHRNFQGYTTDRASALLAFGPSAIGSLPGGVGRPGGYVQNHATVGPWRAAIREGRLATTRGAAVDADTRLDAAVIERLMCSLSVDLAEVAVAHRRCPSRFAQFLPAIDRLAADGLVVRSGWKLAIPREARAFVRHVCAVFDGYRRDVPQRHAAAV
jgi:oxygen-independent coproporphyrinogen-3 oxidase